MVCLPPGPHLSFRSAHRRLPCADADCRFFRPRSQVKVILHQLPQQLAPLLFEQFLQLVIGHTPRRAPASVATRRSKALREAAYASGPDKAS